MKRLLSVFFGLITCVAFAQDINMQNGTFTQCGGILSDSGGNSDYSNNEFLHFGPWQRGTVFENVRIGEHIIYVRDLLNCNEISEKKIVIGYPKFFTPNGDGYHDTWNIIGMTVKSSSKIYIFDRYGKLLKQLSPTGEGWDGTFNGERLPSSDYWFVLDYNDPVTVEVNQLRANFTLKR